MHKVRRFGLHAAGTALFLSIVCSVILLPAGRALGGEPLLLAPVNPGYVAWQNERDEALAAGRSTVQVTSDGHALGFIPSRIDWSHLRSTVSASSAAAKKMADYPAVYDLRIYGRVTPVRDQSYCGSCWAFGAFASLESALLPGKQTDFSENHLLDQGGFDPGPCDGGDYTMATSYLAGWVGPVPENRYPYQYLLANSPLPATNPSAVMAAYHAQDVRIMALTQDSMKDALIKYGAVAISFYIGTPYYNKSTYGYYCNSYKVANHAVAVVGWDDNYSRKNFLKTPPGDGAYLVKNSWGTDWGDKGYFWMSYYDKSLDGTAFVFYKAESTSNYNRIYQYDALGATDYMGYGANWAWMANIFKGNPQGTTINAVSFYAPAESSIYTVTIYDNVTTTVDSNGDSVVKPVSGTRVARQTGTVTAGYHTIKLAKGAKITSGKNFSVVLQLKTPGYNYPIAIEAPRSGYSSHATALPGQSYVSSDGAKWYDLTKDSPNANVCVKAFGSK